MMELSRKAWFVSAKGGMVGYINKDGEVLKSVPVAPGRVRALPYILMAPYGADLEVDGLDVWEPGPVVGIQPYGQGSHDSGANPDWRPTPASRFEREMRMTIGKLQSQMRATAARDKARAKVERVRQAPAPVVIEPAGDGQ